MNWTIEKRMWEALHWSERAISGPSFRTIREFDAEHRPFQPSFKLKISCLWNDSKWRSIYPWNCLIELMVDGLSLRLGIVGNWSVSNVRELLLVVCFLTRPFLMFALLRVCCICFLCICMLRCNSRLGLRSSWWLESRGEDMAPNIGAGIGDSSKSVVCGSQPLL